ncbi:MAG: low molecular weight phosphatase family protein [Candidatus Puniceispirillaceae bacterium]
MAKMILYVCNLNAVRSVLAEYMTNHWYDSQIKAQSCGVIAGSPDGYAASVALEHQIDITEHESRYLSDMDLAGFDEIISLSEEAAQEVARLSLPEQVRTAFWPVRDFVGVGQTRDERLVVYRSVFEEIETHILGHFGSKKG